MNSHYLLFVSLLLINTTSLAKETTPTPPVTSSPEKTTSTSPATTEPDTAVLEQGKQLHNTNCVSCHDTSLYTRENRMIKRYESLKTQVQRCATNLNKPWFDDEVDAVAAYLNTNYYLFKEEKSPQ
ncbi:MAG: cytochrome c [Thioploca sp.]|nr:cytochrome c [Thioploca sp.]